MSARERGAPRGGLASRVSTLGVLLALLIGCAAPSTKPGSDEIPGPASPASTEAGTGLEEVDAAGPIEGLGRARARADERRAAMRERLAGYTLVDHEGHSRRVYEDLVRDRSVMIQFMYTTCDGT